MARTESTDKFATQGGCREEPAEDTQSPTDRLRIVGEKSEPYSDAEAAAIVRKASDKRKQPSRQVKERLNLTPHWWNLATQAADLGAEGIEHALRLIEKDDPAAHARTSLALYPAAASGDLDHDDHRKPNEANDDPHRLARVYLETRCNHPDRTTLVYHMGEFHKWNGAYRTILDKTIRADLTSTSKVEFNRINLDELEELHQANTRKGKKEPTVIKVTTSLTNNIVQALAGENLT